MPLYSSPLFSQRTLKLIGLGCQGTPSRIEQTDEIRVSPVVVDDEAGVDGILAALVFDVDRMGVAADVGTGLKYRHIVRAAHLIGSHHAGNTRTDNRNAHSVGSSLPPVIRLSTVIRRPPRNGCGRPRNTWSLAGS